MSPVGQISLTQTIVLLLVVWYDSVLAALVTA